MSLRQEEELLLDEWKKNVDLYIDQDKRGLERIKMFLTVHAGLLVFYSLMWGKNYDLWAALAGCLIAGAGVSLTVITRRMSTRAHSFIHLRRTQAMLIERKLKNLIAPDSPWKTESGIITTFTRERVLFHGETLKQEEFGPQASEWQPLIDEIKCLGEHTYQSVIPLYRWSKSMGHLDWLVWLHRFLYFFWTALAVLILFACIWDC